MGQSGQHSKGGSEANQEGNETPAELVKKFVSEFRRAEVDKNKAKAACADRKDGVSKWTLGSAISYHSSGGPDGRSM